MIHNLHGGRSNLYMKRSVMSTTSRNDSANRALACTDDGCSSLDEDLASLGRHGGSPGVEVVLLPLVRDSVTLAVGNTGLGEG